MSCYLPFFRLYFSNAYAVCTIHYVDRTYMCILYSVLCTQRCYLHCILFLYLLPISLYYYIRIVRVNVSKILCVCWRQCDYASKRIKTKTERNFFLLTTAMATNRESVGW